MRREKKFINIRILYMPKTGCVKCACVHTQVIACELRGARRLEELRVGPWRRALWRVRVARTSLSSSACERELLGEYAARHLEVVERERAVE